MDDRTFAATAEPNLVQARMLNEFAYCPRLFYLEAVDHLFADSADTVNGRFVHRRVDVQQGDVPPAAAEEETIHARSVLMSDAAVGLIARIDLVEADGDMATPVDYKRGRPPDNPERCWEPERVQLCAQALILRSHGYRCEAGVLYFAGARERVSVPITDDLVARTLDLLAESRLVADQETAPPPLVDSPKCPRCSLVGICLPDETHMVATTEDLPPICRPHVRLLYAAKPDAAPVYVTEQGAHVGKSGERLVVRADGAVLADVRLIDVSQVVVFGGVQVSTPTLHELAQREIPVVYLSHGGYFYGTFQGLPRQAVQRRIRQFALAADADRSLAVARQIVRGKILNQRTLLRRNARELPERIVPQLRRLALAALRAKSYEALLGVEGSAANLYFSHFQRMLAAPAGRFDFAGRNRRPPKDPVNAVLSLCYAMLTKDLTVTVSAVGLDPYVGCFHRPGRGRPALALDLMEEFRPVVADSVVLNVINRSMVREGDFIARAGAVALTPGGRRKVIEAYEHRMAATVTHPVFGYQVSYRRALEVQTRLFSRFMTGELPRYVPFLVR